MLATPVLAVLALLLVLPWLGFGDYPLHLMVVALIWSYIYTSWAIMGRLGMVSFGHAAFLGIGGYAVGILAHEGINSGFIQWPVALIACTPATGLGQTVEVSVQVDGEDRRVVITGGKEGLFDVLEAEDGDYVKTLDMGIQDYIVAIDPESGALVRELAVAGHAGTAFDGRYLWQLADDRIQKVDPRSGEILGLEERPWDPDIDGSP